MLELLLSLAALAAVLSLAARVATVLTDDAVDAVVRRLW